MLEAQQGDRISGKISRKQVASVAVAALGTDASIGEGHVICLASGLVGMIVYRLTTDMKGLGSRISVPAMCISAVKCLDQVPAYVHSSC